MKRMVSKQGGFTENISCRSILFYHVHIAIQLQYSYLLDRAVGTVAMGANPLAVTAEMANSKAELSFIVLLFCYKCISLHYMIVLYCRCH